MTRRASPGGSSATPLTRWRKGSSGAQTPNITLGQAATQGGLADACKLIHLGWTMRPIVNSLMLDFPTLSIDDAKALYQYAAEACASATLLNQRPANYVHSSNEVPHVKE